MGTKAPNNPEGVRMGMDITVGELPPQKTKGSLKAGEASETGSKSFFHGIMPNNKFIDEKYFEKWKKKQVVYKKRLAELRKRRINKATQEKLDYEHNMIMCLAGPEWYQELSPQQKEIIDNLRDTMKKDLDTHLTRATQSCLSHLGMLPLPNDSQLWRALIDSEGCPIEFLLVLYQLIKPERKYYSINDRLLLSGVAHLCLKHTMREMHIRFPSPPRKEPEPTPRKPKIKKKKYAHVYLTPFTFKWPKKKSYQYKNPIVQKPECSYFSYICDFKSVCLTHKDATFGFREPARPDDDVKIPCELFQDHIEAEEYYNLVFRRVDTSTYILMRPKLYESSTPKTYPGVLSALQTGQKYPPPIKLYFDIKIYDEQNPKTSRVRKVLRATCEVRTIPMGRYGQKMGAILIARYSYIKNLAHFLGKPKFQHVSSTEVPPSGYPCSICGGPQAKFIKPDIMTSKQKGWTRELRRNFVKKERIEHRLSDFLLWEAEKLRKDAIVLDQNILNLKKENEQFLEAWQRVFKNIEKMEKLRIETQECVCPDHVKHKFDFDVKAGCTCAIWNIPPKSEDKIDCECKPEIKVEDVIYTPPPEVDKCDCKRKLKEKLMEACEACGIHRPKNKEDTEECVCTKNLDACGDCVQKTPTKYPYLEEQRKNETQECSCIAKLPENGQELTVAYVFVDNKIPNTTKQSKDCKCKSATLTDSKRSSKEKNKCRTNEKKEKNRKKIKSDQLKCSKSPEKLTENKENEKKAPTTKTTCETEEECLLNCGRVSQLQYCKKETEKLITLLKCDCAECKEFRRTYRAQYIHAGTRDSCGGALPIIGGTIGIGITDCDCLYKFEQTIQGISEYKKRMEAKVNLKSQENKYIISGMHQTDQGPVYNITGVIPENPCTCRDSNEKLIGRSKAEKIPEKIKKDKKYVLSGIKGSEYTIETITKECQCSEVYKMFTEEHNKCLVNYEEYLEYMETEINAYMEEMKYRYQDPPLTDKEMIEREMNMMMGAPGLPIPDRNREYVISGVQGNKDAKTFVLGGTLLSRSKERTIAVHNYNTKGITKCQKSYLLCNYMTFGRNCGNPFQPEREIEVEKISDEIVCRCISYESIVSSSVEEEGDEEENVDGCACECPCSELLKVPPECECAEAEEIDPCVCSSDDLEKKEIEAPYGCTCANLDVKSSGTASDPCVCDFKNCGCQVDEICVKECFYGPIDEWWSTSNVIEKKSDTGQERDLFTFIGGPSKRYVILHTFPTSWEKQKNIIKKLLSGMAKDGYPLAKLPECEKIPYFWLWMQFRLKKRWNYDDAIKNLKRCQKLWSHMRACTRKVLRPKLGVYCKCEELGFDWSQAKRGNKLVEESRARFYDMVRKNMVDFAREFYATLSAYQYPKPSHLTNTFYAYQPSKMEDVFVEFVWQPHEHKDPQDLTSCLCK